MYKYLRDRVIRNIDRIREKRVRRVLCFAILNASILFQRNIRRKLLFGLKKCVRATLPSIVNENLTRFVSRTSLASPTARRYIRKDMVVEDFFSELKKRKLNYVVLRWFEKLPNVPKGEDIDLLIADKDVNKLADLCEVFNNGNQALDIYSVSGLPRSNYRNIPYYPPRLATEILETKDWQDDLYAVPNHRYHFLSLAYHSIFHKGKRSGLTFLSEGEKSESDHDYATVLARIGKKAKLEIQGLDFESLYEFLKSIGWIPELDTFRILAREDPWLRRILSNSTSDVLGDKGELMVFVVRQWAIENNKLDLILDLLERKRIDIIECKFLEREEVDSVKNAVRGGKWDAGPYPVSGGDPAAIVVAFDYAPVPATLATQTVYPFVRNEHILVKHHIRDYINREQYIGFHVNCLHSADDETEAWHYIESALPRDLEKIKGSVRKRRELYYHDYSVVKSLNPNGSRSKTEMIERSGIISVMKTFRLGCERFAAREAFVYNRFGKSLDSIPPLEESGSNYIIIPWYENVLEGKSDREKKKIIRRHTREILFTMKSFYDHGYAIIGFYPGNLIVTPSDQLKIVDFEFLYQYEKKPRSFAESYDLVGVPEDFDGDMPRGPSNHTLKNTWKNFFDASVINEFLKD